MQRLEVSCAVRPIYGSLGAKGLNCYLFFRFLIFFHSLLESIHVSFLLDKIDCLEYSCYFHVPLLGKCFQPMVALSKRGRTARLTLKAKLST
jgi:hypothetical protein